jgi:hypothetical protein
MSTVEELPDSGLLKRTPDANDPFTPKRSKSPSFRHWLFQGGITGIVAGFLLAFSQIVVGKSPYDFLVIPGLPIYLVWGLVAGTVQSLILWLVTKLIRRHLGVFFRVFVSLLLFVLPFVAYWWITFQPDPEPYHSFGSSRDELASLRGIKAVKLFVNPESSTLDTKDVTKPQLRNLIIFKLNDAGIEVVPNESEAQHQAILCVDYNFWEDTTQKGYHYSNIRVAVRQDVVVSRDPNLQTEATTWEYYGNSFAGGSFIPDQVMEAVASFVESYRIANSDNPPQPDYQEEARSRVRWQFLSFALAIVFIGSIAGSKLQPWRLMAYGFPRKRNELSKLAIVTGFALRSVVVFLLMESILVLIATLRSEYPSPEFWRAHLYATIFLAHCLLSLFVALGRLKFAIVFNLALAANLIVLLLCWFDRYSNRTEFFALEYSFLWAVYILTRFTLAQTTFSYLKQEFRYYLTD